MVQAEWFVDWFDSPYYHLLYNHRNYAEADLFIGHLSNHMQLPAGSTIWDLACGKGRHSLALAKLGYDVTGTDLSKSSIEAASKQSHEHLRFLVHDMRQPFLSNQFDAVFNLFTSIGYFVDMNDNQRVFENVYAALKPGGSFVIDFLNAEKFCDFTTSAYEEKRDELVFKIKKEKTNNAIVKRIEFESKGKAYFFEEQVSLLRFTDFDTYARNAGFSTVSLYGNYQLQEYDPLHSERLILHFKK